MMYDSGEVERVAGQIRAPFEPQVGIITGSGLSGLAEEVEEPLVIPYGEIADFPPVTVEGHPGQMVLGHLAGKAVVVMQGRAHFYEGSPLGRITLPVRVMRALGADTLIVTNAAGGLNEGFKAGDLMLITDHINLVGMAGHSPLFGPNDERLGPRFVDMSGAYDKELRKIALEVGDEAPPLRRRRRSASFASWERMRWGCPPPRRWLWPGTGGCGSWASLTSAIWRWDTLSRKKKGSTRRY